MANALEDLIETDNSDTTAWGVEVKVCVASL